ncbi:hypothetical protein GCM10010112_83070 [Actinoplanes lobatus]|uniref:DNA processing protein n=1 Tax=Actinoplanes lobatus TaxID=113568 RepID=A0A7W7MJX5_9ACTN|nr:DNA-processing protein DprA [Actinoplanes lobatus]MBB4752505.1 DNA processing protein [Actinoplanes lobatus]GGN94087.1 hypothetical protein GCM10010112_83070 [Actinoplanes lobatus]GIE44805.1 hypothetical protein Alo02nite_77030 [Actinoplanes lobatus]
MASLPDDERLARAALTYIAQPGDPTTHTMIGTLGPVEALDRLLTSTRRRTTGQPWQHSSPVRLARTRLHAELVRLIVPGDFDWPDRLDQLAHLDTNATATVGSPLAPPIALWADGALPLSTALGQAVTITGARACTAYGQHVAADITTGCAQQGWTIVAGGSYGIEAAAHRAALANDTPTVAVIAGGLHRPHPAGNSALFDQIRRTGLLVSETPPDVDATRPLFISRQRLLAALTDGTVLVEAAIRSSSLITAKAALVLEKPTMAVPGAVTSALSAGCHHLLRDPRVRLVTDAADVFTVLGQR